MTCQIIARLVVDGFGRPQPVAEQYCETHDMVGAVDGLCAIGRIEQCTTVALERINSATDDAVASVLDAKEAQ